MTNSLRAVYRFWAMLLFPAVIVQVGAAGYGAFNAAHKVSDTTPLTQKQWDHGFGFHDGVRLHPVPGVAAPAAASRSPLVSAASGCCWRSPLPLLVFVQILLAVIGGGTPAIGALHPVERARHRRASPAIWRARRTGRPGRPRLRTHHSRHHHSTRFQTPGIELAAVGADRREGRGGVLQLLHRTVAASCLVQDVREVVAERGLPVAVALGGAELERLAQQRLGLRQLAVVGVVEREVVQRRDPDARVGQAGRLLEAPLEIARARSRAGRECCWPARPAQGARIVGEPQRLEAQRAGAVGVAAPPGDPAAVRLDDGRVGPETERLDVVALGQLPVAAAFVDDAELVLDPARGGRLALRRRRVVRGERGAVGALQRVARRRSPRTGPRGRGGRARGPPRSARSPRCLLRARGRDRPAAAYSCAACRSCPARSR